MASQTKGWFAVGFGLIALGAGLYGVLALLGISVAIGQATAAAGAPLLLVLLIPGLAALGFLILIAKVVVDRLGNAEDDHYSKTVDR